MTDPLPEKQARTRPASKPRKPRGPKKATAGYLENAALYYLERFATSSENLRRVLMRKVIRSAQTHGTDPDEGADMIAALIARYQSAGLLDDRAYARARATTLHRAGNSARAIRGKLAQKGVAADQITDALDALEDDDDGDPELRAAVRLAKKRRLGPFRSPDVRADKRDKDLAALARAGFSYDIARTVIEAETTDELDEST